MNNFSYELKIPRERVAVLIGKQGELKKTLEGDTNTSINIDSKEGDVVVSGDDALGLYTAREIIRAVGRGFNPDIARLLLKQDYVFEIINLNEYAKNKESMIRLKGRVIGRDGKSRKLIEELTECYICIFGKTISIIGNAESSGIAKQAIESLLRGSTHANVYKWLEKRRREIKRRKIVEMV